MVQAKATSNVDQVKQLTEDATEEELLACIMALPPDRAQLAEISLEVIEHFEDILKLHLGYTLPTLGVEREDDPECVDGLPTIKVGRGFALYAIYEIQYMVGADFTLQHISEYIKRPNIGIYWTDGEALEDMLEVSEVNHINLKEDIQAVMKVEFMDPLNDSKAQSRIPIFKEPTFEILLSQEVCEPLQMIQLTGEERVEIFKNFLSS